MMMIVVSPKFHTSRNDGRQLRVGHTAMSGLETVRQTLMTHMWPNMIRKPLGTRENPSIAAIEHDSALSSPREGDGQSSSAITSPIRAHFPMTFESSPAGPSWQRLDRSIMLSGDGDIHDSVAFPGLDELKAQIQLADLEEFEKSGMFGRRGRLDAMDEDWDDVEPGAEEYARLDEWLDADELQDMSTALDDQEGLGVEDEIEASAFDEDVLDVKDGERQLEEGPSERSSGQDHDAFEDDFDDFSAFQSAPVNPTSRNDGLLSLDPTPLLLHLQNVRAELAGVSDEDERRVRAGKEVARVMRDLGMGGDLGLDDLDGLKE